MERYPDLCIWVNDFDRTDFDGRRNSRDLGGRPRVQILFDGSQQEFKITHPQLKPSEIDSLLSFYKDNLVKEFEFHNPEDSKIYTCLFWSAPKFSRFNGLLKDVTFTLAGYLKDE